MLVWNCLGAGPVAPIASKVARRRSRKKSIAGCIMKRILLAAAASLIVGNVVACGVFEKKHGSNEAKTPVAQPGDTFVAPAVDLKLNSGSDEGEPNALSVDTTGKAKVHGDFNFSADASYDLRLASISRKFQNCKGDEPSVNFSWAESGTSTPGAALTQAAPAQAIQGKGYVLSVDVDNSAGCTGMQVSFAVRGVKVSANSGATSSNSIDDVDFDYEVVVREFGSFGGHPDRAVLLIAKPSRGTLKVTNVRGPQTSQGVYSGTLEKVNAKIKIFTESSHPIADTRRKALLDSYGSATAVYLEHYDNPLCDEYSHQYILEGNLEGTPITTTFTVQATAQSEGDCSLTVVGFLTHFESQ